MTQPSRAPLTWPIAIILLLVAGALGFAAAHWQAARNVPATAPVAAAPAANPTTGDIKIPADYLQAAQITVEAVGAGGLGGEILTTGTVAGQPNSEAVVVARASGNVTRVLGRLGDPVKAGEALAQVDSADAAAMAAERSVTRAKAELAQKVYTREAALFAQGVTPRQDMEAAQSALAVATSEARRATLVAQAAHVGSDGKSVTVVSPIAGTISAQAVTLGAFVQPQTELFHIAGSGQVQIEAALGATDVKRVAIGDKATIVPASGAPVDATVRALTPTVSAVTRSAIVVLTPASGARVLVIGEGVQVRLHVRSASAGTVVPEDAVQNVDGRDVLFVRTSEGFRPQPVVVSMRSGGMASIVSGIAPSVKIATRNAFLIKADMIKSARED
jgi:cobalt-zinc-cadmium efflux system membrane fusion protein